MSFRFQNNAASLESFLSGEPKFISHSVHFITQSSRGIFRTEAYFIITWNIAKLLSIFFIPAPWTTNSPTFKHKISDTPYNFLKSHVNQSRQYLIADTTRHDNMLSECFRRNDITRRRDSGLNEGVKKCPTRVWLKPFVWRLRKLRVRGRDMYDCCGSQTFTSAVVASADGKRKSLFSLIRKLYFCRLFGSIKVDYLSSVNV